MIKITIEGPVNLGKSLIAMRIANMLQQEGVDVTVLTESVPVDIITMFYNTPINELTPKFIACEIHDLNGNKFFPGIHNKIGFKGMR